MHAPLLPFYAGAAKGCGGAGGSQLQPAAGPKLCREPDGRRPPAAPGGGRAGSARAGGAQHRRACGPSAWPLQELPEGAPAPCRSPQKKEEPFGSPVNVIRF